MYTSPHPNCSFRMIRLVLVCLLILHPHPHHTPHSHKPISLSMLFEQEATPFQLSHGRDWKASFLASSEISAPRQRHEQPFFSAGN